MPSRPEQARSDDANRLRLATRGSALARWQAEHVAALLQAAHPGLDVELVLVETTGDVRTDVPITPSAARACS